MPLLQKTHSSCLNLLIEWWSTCEYLVIFTFLWNFNYFQLHIVSLHSLSRRKLNAKEPDLQIPCKEQRTGDSKIIKRMLHSYITFSRIYIPRFHCLYRVSAFLLKRKVKTHNMRNIFIILIASSQCHFKSENEKVEQQQRRKKRRRRWERDWERGRVSCPWRLSVRTTSWAELRWNWIYAEMQPSKRNNNNNNCNDNDDGRRRWWWWWWWWWR